MLSLSDQRGCVRRVRASLPEFIVLKQKLRLCGEFTGKWEVGNGAARKTSRGNRTRQGPVAEEIFAWLGAGVMEVCHSFWLTPFL